MTEQAEHIAEAERLLDEAQDHFLASKIVAFPSAAFDEAWNAMNAKMAFVNAHIAIATAMNYNTAASGVGRVADAFERHIDDEQAEGNTDDQPA